MQNYLQSYQLLTHSTQDETHTSGAHRTLSRRRLGIARRRDIIHISRSRPTIASVTGTCLLNLTLWAQISLRALKHSDTLRYKQGCKNLAFYVSRKP